jgi:hypothetical protein
MSGSWDETFDAWKAQGMTKVRMMETVTEVCHPDVVHHVFDLLFREEVAYEKVGKQDDADSGVRR